MVYIFCQDSIYWDLGIKIDSKNKLKKSYNISQKDKTLIDQTIEMQVLDLTKKLNINRRQDNTNENRKVERRAEPTLIYTNKTKEPESAQKIGTGLFQEGKYKESLYYFEKLNSSTNLKEEEREKINYLRANALFQIGEHQKSQNILENLIKNKNTVGDDALVLLGMIFKKRGNKKKALELFTQILNEYPNSEFIESAKIQQRILLNNKNK